MPQRPAWTVADVLAHVVGVNADFVAGIQVWQSVDGDPAAVLTGSAFELLRTLLL